MGVPKNFKLKLTKEKKIENWKGSLDKCYEKIIFKLLQTLINNRK
jgi:hypothetical protein